jgi:hypothetical protein
MSIGSPEAKGGQPLCGLPAVKVTPLLGVCLLEHFHLLLKLRLECR